MAAASWKWTLNGKGAVTTETYTVPADANAGDAIKVVVTAEDGQTAEDVVYVGGFTILKVEPTTAQGARGYKYVRAYFSTGLKSLTPEDLEIRAVKSQQLYSVEAVKLSSDGTFADITIAGDTSMSDSSFLMAGTKYGCTVTQSDDTAYLEFELPTFYSDLTVTGVDLENAKVTVSGSGRVKKTEDATDRWDYYGQYEIGDIYEGNLGSLLGRHVNMNVNSEGQVTDFYVQDEAIVIGSMKFTADSTSDAANKWYFKDQLTDKKYYYSTTENASNNATQAIQAVDNSSEGLDWSGNTTYAYAKLVMNPNGTVASAVLADTLNQTIICTTNEKGKITQDADRAVDLSGYTVERDGDYVDAKTIEPGDIIFYNTATKFADIFNYEVSGEIGTVYTTKVDIDGTTYDLDNAQRFDADNLKYVPVKEKWLLSLDDEVDTTINLNRQKKVKFVEGVETGKTVTTDTDYVVVKNTTVYTDKGETYLNLFVSDGSSYSTIPVKVTALSSYEGFDVSIKLDDDTKGGAAVLKEIYTGTADEKAAAKAVIGFTENDPASTVTALAAQIDEKDLITVTTKDSTGAVIGIAHKNTAPMTGSAGGSLANSFESTDTSVSTAGGKYSLLDGTHVWILSAATSGSRELDASLKNFESYTGATVEGAMAKVGVFASTSNKTAVDSVVIDNVDGNTITGGVVKTRVNGMIVGYETGLATDDQKTYELKKLTVWVPNADGGEKVTYTTADFANQIKKVNANGAFDGDYTNDTGITDTVSQLAFDADGKLLFVSTDAAVAGTPDDAAVTTVTDPNGITASNSATEITLSDGKKLKLADDALILQFNKAKDYKVTTISDINLNENYTAEGKRITYHQTLGTTANKVVDVLVVKYAKVSPTITAGTWTPSAQYLNTVSGELAPATTATCSSGDDVTYSLADGTNAGFSINASNGTLSWSAGLTDGTTYQVPIVQSVTNVAAGYEKPTAKTTIVSIKFDNATAIAALKTAVENKVDAYTTATTTLAANTDPTANTTKKSAADTAKNNADEAIEAWEAASGLTFSDANITGKKTAYDAAGTRVAAYETAAAATAPTAGYASTSEVASVTPTKTTGWTYKFAGTGANLTVTETTGEVIFTGNGTVTVTATASLDGFATNVTITNPKVTMANWNTNKGDITAGTAS